MKIEHAKRSTSRTPYRFRQCPRCKAVHAAGELICHTRGRTWGHGTALRECPTCGFYGQTAEFPIARDTRHPEYAHT